MAMKKGPAPKAPVMDPNSRLSPQQAKTVAKKIRKMKDSDGLEAHSRKA